MENPKAGLYSCELIQSGESLGIWVPAFAGMSG